MAHNGLGTIGLVGHGRKNDLVGHRTPEWPSWSRENQPMAYNGLGTIDLVGHGRKNGLVSYGKEWRNRLDLAHDG